MSYLSVVVHPPSSWHPRARCWAHRKALFSLLHADTLGPRVTAGGLANLWMDILHANLKISSDWKIQYIYIYTYMCVCVQIHKHIKTKIFPYKWIRRKTNTLTHIDSYSSFMFIDFMQLMDYITLRTHMRAHLCMPPYMRSPHYQNLKTANLRRHQHMGTAERKHMPAEYVRVRDRRISSRPSFHLTCAISGSAGFTWTVIWVQMALILAMLNLGRSWCGHPPHDTPHDAIYKHHAIICTATFVSCLNCSSKNTHWQHMRASLKRYNFMGVLNWWLTVSVLNNV